MNIEPLSNRVVIKPKEADKKTAGGLYIPDAAVEKPQVGTIVAKGDECPDKIQVDDVVMYNKNSGISVMSEQTEYLLIKYNELLAKFTDYGREDS